MFAPEKFRIIELTRAVATAKPAPANDNRRAERHAPATPGRMALVGRWRKNGQTGRLEWHWSLEAVSDEPAAPQSPSRALHAGHTRGVLDTTPGVGRPDCHPTDTQLDVVQRSGTATLTFVRN